MTKDRRQCLKNDDHCNRHIQHAHGASRKERVAMRHGVKQHSDTAVCNSTLLIEPTANTPAYYTYRIGSDSSLPTDRIAVAQGRRQRH